ncbi:MAG: 4'-phosphopantetheinyl transferase superfamily protein [Spirochaetota bacterium]
MKFGNDIIDRQIYESSRLVSNKRFFKKVFTDKEFRFIENSSDANLTAMSLWALKESAYKAISRQKSDIFFAYKQFEVNLANKQIYYQDCVLQADLIVAKKFVHGICREANHSYCLHAKVDSKYSLQRCIPYSSYQGKEQEKMSLESFLVREQAKFLLCQMSGNLAAKELHIAREKDDLGKIKPPHIEMKNKQKIPISLSHHGDFFASLVILPKE